MSPAALETQARDFALELSHTVRTLVPAASPFEAIVMERKDGSQAFTVKQQPDEGIPLSVQGDPLLKITVEYFCSLDGAEAFLAVERSKVHVYALAEGEREPLFRYDYLRSATDSMPSAHIQLHAHRNAFAYVMAKAGTSTARGKRRAKGATVPAISKVHFPVGGPRFRPCLEDVLEVLVHEFGVDHTVDGLESLRAGRERWRRTQLRSSVRDAPQEAAAVLQTLGYTVYEPSEAATVNLTRLREL